MIETKTNIAREVVALKQMTVKELRGRYLEVFGEAARSGNKDWLWKRIAWRMQANVDGDLTERARRRAEELANDADLRMRRPPALLEELVDFFPQARRKVLAKALAKLQKLQSAALAAVETRLDSPELDRQMAARLQQLENSSGSVLESSVSPPTMPPTATARLGAGAPDSLPPPASLRACTATLR